MPHEAAPTKRIFLPNAVRPTGKKSTKKNTEKGKNRTTLMQIQYKERVQ